MEISNYYFNFSVKKDKGNLVAKDISGKVYKIADKRACHELGFNIWHPLAIEQLLKAVAIVWDKSEKSEKDLSEKGKVIKQAAESFINAYNLTEYSYACLFREAIKTSI